MIKNIPNKYTREMLIELFDRTHKKKYDFLYLPIDPSVLLPLFRTPATSAMHLSTSWDASISASSTKFSTGRSGSVSIARRSAG